MRVLTTLLLLLCMSLSGFAQLSQPQRAMYGTKDEVRRNAGLAGVFIVPTFANRTHEVFIKDQADTTSPESDSVIVSLSGVRFKRLSPTTVTTVTAAAWSSITGKPSEFTPSAHNQAISTITGLTSALAAKQDTITSGATNQFFGWGKVWRTLDKTYVGLSNVPNIDATNANNLASGTILAARFGAATIPLSAFSQSSATTGQIPKWNGSAWVASADNSSGTTTWGGLTGTLSAQTDLQSALDARVATSRTISTGGGLTGGGTLVADRAISIEDNGVTNAKLATMATATVKGNISGSTATPSDVSVLSLPISTATQAALDAKQAALVSATNIKTINGTSLLGSGDITISGGSGGLAEPSTNGVVVRTSSGVTAARTFAVSGAGISVSNGDGVSGNPTYSLTNDIGAIEALTGTGIAKRTGTDTWSLGTVTLTTEVSGILPTTNGGAGTANGILKANGSGTVSAAIAGTDYLTPSGSAASLTSFPTLNQNTTGTASNVTGTVAIANGGTGATTAAGARTNLGATTVGANIFTLTNPNATTFPRLNSDNTVSALDADAFRAAIGAGSSAGAGTVTSISGTGTVSGLSLSGSVTTTGSLTLGGTLAVAPSNFASQTANFILAAPNGSSGTPTFRALVAADIPTLNQNTTGTASNVTGTVAIANGGTGTTTAAGARTNLGATTVGSNLFTLTNPSAITFPRLNADNTVSALDAASFRAAIGAGTPTWGGVIGTLSNQTDLQTALNLKAPLASPTFTGTVGGITKSMVGLANVDNTSDAAKPISTATQTALNGKEPTITTGSINLNKIAQSSASTGQVPKWNGTAWIPDTDNAGSAGYVKPEDYGAVGNGTTDDRAALQAMFDANQNGWIVFTKGKNYKVVGTLSITGTGNEANSLKIDGYGAKITTTNAVTTAVVLFNNCMRTSVRGLEIDGTVDFDGWYFGNMEDCYLKRLRFGNQNLDAIDETYWSQWSRCKIANGIYIHTGTAGDRTEFNANSFYNCNIWYDTYAFHIYGDQIAQNCNFYSCDISYQTVGRMEIEQQVLDAQFNFYSCYWDDDFNIPVNTKGVVVNTYGFGNNPNSGNIGSHATLQTGSQNDVSSSYGGRTGSRIPTSGYNLIINGDLKSGKNNITTDWATNTVTAGSGLHGSYIHFADNTSAIKTAEWTAIPAPFTGWYAVTLIGRNVGNTAIVFSNVVNGTDVYYNPVSVNDQTDFVVSTGKVYLTQGQIYKFRLFSAANTANSVDVAYVGLTFGRTGGLTAVEHPKAATVKTITSYYEGSSANAMFTLPIVANERISAKCTCYGVDPSYPDGATFNEMVIVANHNGALTYSVTSQAAIKTGDISAAPSFTLTTSGSNLLLNATPQDGLIRLTCELKGIFK